MASAAPRGALRHLRQALATLDKDKGFSLVEEESLTLGLPASMPPSAAASPAGRCMSWPRPLRAQFGAASRFRARDSCPAHGGRHIRALHPDRLRGARSRRALRPRARLSSACRWSGSSCCGCRARSMRCGPGGGAEIPRRRRRDRRAAGDRRSRRLHRHAAARARRRARAAASGCCSGTARCRSRPRPRPAGRSPPRRARPTASAA